MSECALCHTTRDDNNPLTWILTCDTHLRDECYSCYKKMHGSIPYMEDELRKKRSSHTAEEHDYAMEAAAL